jgi:hypothetical protein
VAAGIQELVLITELLEPITVAEVAQAVIQIQLLAVQDIKALLLYDIEIDKEKYGNAIKFNSQRHRISKSTSRHNCTTTRVANSRHAEI